MGKINFGRVILGGLLAGLIINIGEFVLNTYVIGEQSAAIMERLGLDAISNTQIAWFVLISFVLAIVMVFLYAAIRPRFGAGTGTAILAGVTIWFVMMLSAVADAIIGLVPLSLILVAGIWGIVEFAIAAVAGAWVYREAA
jgi:hypothetical protein